MTPWLDDGDVRLYHGDVRDVLAELPDQSVDCVVTSPPYWGLRDYGTGQWDGGNPDCDHRPRQFTDGCVGCGAPMHEATEGCAHCADRMLKREIRGTGDRRYEERDLSRPDLPNPPASWAKRDVTVRGVTSECSCGARRIDQQLGLEPTPDLFVANMVAVFREVRRVLADHGTCWINLGDSYAGSWGAQSRELSGGDDQGANGSSRNPSLSTNQIAAASRKQSRTGAIPEGSGLKPKDLVGIPWRVAFALQADGWYLRSDIIWAKPNPMPESVTDRPTKAHEYVFLLAKQPRYWFDAEAVREPHTTADDPRNRNGYEPDRGTWVGGGVNDGRTRTSGASTWPTGGRNVRSVWQIATQPYPEAHFATFPEELARRCILAGCPTRVCRVCGKPSERIVDVSPMEIDRSERTHALGHTRSSGTVTRPREAHTVGWTDCECNEGGENEDEDLVRASEMVGGDVLVVGPTPIRTSPQNGPVTTESDLLPSPRWRPGIVLDPFIGSGTVAKVARDHGRHAIGIDLSSDYLELAARRLQQLSLLT